MKRPIYRILINTLVFWIAAQFLSLHAATPLHYLGAGLILWLVNLLIRPVLIILTIPLNLLTLGIFTVIINTWMILLTSALVPGFYVRGFGTALLVSILVSLANWGFKKVLRQH
ncbi:phage holin family protein [Desulfosporosinus sp. PR]|uniref:phage holin family protein n=1 Tax=Candidatus Desulfosporosinus nitrosoreducens TaxID=3401928 RepID=UPI0027FCE666|nr:phage holin family protein [Desulfosporosinus sp. PR]MDQ7092371.1 phage holin family protein [Desulfosporosinus sp. PR]